MLALRAQPRLQATKEVMVQRQLTHAAAPRPVPRHHYRRLSHRISASAASEAAAQAAAAAEGEQRVWWPAQQQQEQQQEGAGNVSPDWARAIELQQSGEVFETTVMGARGAGITVSIGRLTGFVPYKLCDPRRLAAAEEAAAPEDVAAATGRGGDKEAAAAARERVYASLKGQTLRAKVTQVIVPERRLICSEKAAALDVLCSQVRRGDVVQGTVSSLHDFGALINVESVNGQPAPSAQVCLPLRELSWDWVGSAADVVARGQAVRCTVVRVDAPPRSRVTVSLKRMQKDPLTETLADLLPPSGEGAQGRPSGGGSQAVPSGVQDILEALRREPGITDVALGRRATERRTVSQDLEVWMSKEDVPGGFALVARAGRSVQEIRVATAMGSEEMKAVVQRVLRSLV